MKLPGSWQTFLGIFMLNAMLAYPIFFLVYKHFNPILTPMDIPAYMAMVEDGPGAVEPPYRFRILPPALVKAARPLPGYDIPVAFSAEPGVNRDFFHFLCLNFLLTVSVSALVFIHLRTRFGAWQAYLGSVLYLFSFYSIVTNIIPMTDAACHLAIMACILLFERKRPIWFALACVAGVFAKETLLIVLGLWILARAWRDRRALVYLLYCLPAAVAYLAATRIASAESHSAYYHPGYLFGNALKALQPGEYDRHLVFQIFLAHLPLLAAGAVYLYLRFYRRMRGLTIGPELLLFPILAWLGITMGVGNNSGRIAFMAFPAILPFEVMVIAALLRGPGEDPERLGRA